MKRLFLLLPVFALLAATPAMALHIAPVGGINFAKESVNPAPAGETHSSNMGYTLGVLVELPMMPLLELETGVLYATEKPVITDATSKTETTVKNIKIPVMAKFSLLDMFSVGAGLYYGMAQGEISFVSTPLAGGDPTTGTRTYDQSHYTTSDYGLVAAAGVKFPIMPMAKLLVMGEYEMGLKNRNTDPAAADTTNKSNVFQILAGVSFGL